MEFDRYIQQVQPSSLCRGPELVRLDFLGLYRHSLQLSSVAPSFHMVNYCRCRQEFMENECEALPGVAYPGVRDNRSTLNTKTGYDDDDDLLACLAVYCC